jgi:p-cumate 2,3-dioxygenase subunit alpha
MNAFQRMNTALMVDESKKIFKVSRQAFVDPDILEAERTQIFDKCWLYLGHSSELARPGDFVTRQVGGRNILFARDGKGNLKAMLNTCPHRGAQVCREKHGSAKSFQCFYHGWVFGLDGTLRSQPGETSYAEDFKERSTSNMQQVPRFESYRDFNFICFDKGVDRDDHRRRHAGVFDARQLEAFDRK